MVFAMRCMWILQRLGHIDIGLSDHHNLSDKGFDFTSFLLENEFSFFFVATHSVIILFFSLLKQCVHAQPRNWFDRWNVKNVMEFGNNVIAFWSFAYRSCQTDMYCSKWCITALDLLVYVSKFASIKDSINYYIGFYYPHITLFRT